MCPVYEPSLAEAGIPRRKEWEGQNVAKILEVMPIPKVVSKATEMVEKLNSEGIPRRIDLLSKKVFMEGGG